MITSTQREVTRRQRQPARVVARQTSEPLREVRTHDEPFHPTTRSPLAAEVQESVFTRLMIGTPRGDHRSGQQVYNPHDRDGTSFVLGALGVETFGTCPHVALLHNEFFLVLHDR